MVSRRGFLAGAGLAGVGGVGGWAYGTGRLPHKLQAFLPVGALSVGEGAAFGELTVAVTDVGTATSARYSLGNRARSWTAPEGAKLVLFKLEVSNEDITKHEAPALNLRNYTVLEKDPDTIYIVGVNDIRVFGGDEGAVLPEFAYQSVGVDAITVHERQLEAYPNGTAGSGPWVGPNETLSGWVWGLVEVEKVPGVRVQTEAHAARWRHDDASSEIVPSEDQTIEL